MDPDTFGHLEVSEPGRGTRLRTLLAPSLAPRASLRFRCSPRRCWLGTSVATSPLLVVCIDRLCSGSAPRYKMAPRRSWSWPTRARGAWGKLRFSFHTRTKSIPSPSSAHRLLGSPAPRLPGSPAPRLDLGSSLAPSRAETRNPPRPRPYDGDPGDPSRPLVGRTQGPQGQATREPEPEPKSPPVQVPPARGRQRRR